MSGGISAASIATASTAVQGIGVLASTYGAYTKAQADKQAYEYQAQVAANNAQVATWQAQDAITRGQTNEQNVRLRTAGLMSTQRASMAARGIALDEGSPLDILTTTSYMGERDALTTRDNALREAWGYRANANNDLSNAALLRMRADSSNPLLAGASTFLTGSTAVAKNWYSLSSKGVSGFGASSPTSGSSRGAVGNFDFANA